MDNPSTPDGGKAGPAGQRCRRLLARDAVKPGRPRQINPSIPAHIDQAKLPSDVYFDHRWGGGTWYVLTRVAGKRRRKNLAKASVSLADLHRKLDEMRAGDTRGTVDWLCGLFEASDQFKALAESTREDYAYCRAILAREKDKKSRGVSVWPIEKLTSPTIQLLVDRVGAEHPAKANHLLRYLRRLFRWGGNRGYCAKTNPADKIEPARERRQRTMPSLADMRSAIEYARACGALTTRTKGAQPPYLWAVAEIAYRCRLRGIEVVTLTDAHGTDEGILTNRRKGSRDNVTEWSPALRAAWDSLVAWRAKVWSRRGIATPLRPEDRPLVVSEDGAPLARRVLGTAWKRLTAAAVREGKLVAGTAFGMHAFKRRGITDTVGTMAEKQVASGHKTEAMVHVYDFSVPKVRPAGD